jgi:hypothetical protein
VPFVPVVGYLSFDDDAKLFKQRRISYATLAAGGSSSTISPLPGHLSGAKLPGICQDLKYQLQRRRFP